MFFHHGTCDGGGCERNSPGRFGLRNKGCGESNQNRMPTIITQKNSHIRTSFLIKFLFFVNIFLIFPD
jgi:hypothetical protein